MNQAKAALELNLPQDGRCPHHALLSPSQRGPYRGSYRHRRSIYPVSFVRPSFLLSTLRTEYEMDGGATEQEKLSFHPLRKESEQQLYHLIKHMWPV